MKAAPLLLCLGWLCAGASSASAGTPDHQRLTVQLQGAPADVAVWAEREGAPPIRLEDNGAAVLEGVFEAPPARSAQLRLVEGDPDHGLELWSGLALLAGRGDEHIAFGYDPGEGHPRALRVASSPALHQAAGAEPAGPYLLAFGWGGLTLAYLGFLVLGWARRRGGVAPP